MTSKSKNITSPEQRTGPQCDRLCATTFATLAQESLRAARAHSTAALLTDAANAEVIRDPKSPTAHDAARAADHAAAAAARLDRHLFDHLHDVERGFGMLYRPPVEAARALDTLRAADHAAARALDAVWTDATDAEITAASLLIEAHTLSSRSSDIYSRRAAAHERVG